MMHLTSVKPCWFRLVTNVDALTFVDQPDERWTEAPIESGEDDAELGAVLELAVSRTRGRLTTIQLCQ